MRRSLQQIVGLAFAFSILAANTLAARPLNTLDRKTIRDTLYIYEVEDKKEGEKVLHAEPLFIDLIRDLGARQGEAEWNIGFGLTDRLDYDKYLMLIEYEFAPFYHLGMEFEIPVTLYSARADIVAPSNRIESLKAAMQWSFFVSEEISTSMALGYINELELSDLDIIHRGPIFKSNLYNPFFIAAKRWGNNFHTMVYAGIRIEQPFFKAVPVSVEYEWHTNIHYMIRGTRNFIGLEINKYFDGERFNAVFRPQMRLGIADNVLIGIVVGLPLVRSSERLSIFFRLIYEPPH
ncbi:MAG: HAEPLYID family protein [Chloroherpetonaceae bacterium]|nr:HAEPLYID family protein [Chloroherpetonaceae bacterium]